MLNHSREKIDRPDAQSLHQVASSHYILSGKIQVRDDGPGFAYKCAHHCAGVLYTPPVPLFGAPMAAAGPALFPAATMLSPREPPAQPLLPGQASSPQRRGRASRRDPLEPKQNKTPFNFFSIDARAKAKAANPVADQKVRG